MVRNSAGSSFIGLFHSLSKRAVLLDPIWKNHGQESGVLIGEGARLSWDGNPLPSCSVFRFAAMDRFFDKEYSTNEIRLNLALGPYEYKITALNVFPGKIAAHLAAAKSEKL